MYKHASRNLQRRITRIVEAQPPASAYIAEDDLIATADNMSLEECQAERTQLLSEKVRAENELAASKASGDLATQRILGHRKQSLDSRLGLLAKRIKHLNVIASREEFSTAAREVLDEATFRRVCERAKQIRAGALQAAR